MDIVCVPYMLARVHHDLFARKCVERQRYKIERDSCDGKASESDVLIGDNNVVKQYNNKNKFKVCLIIYNHCAINFISTQTTTADVANKRIILVLQIVWVCDPIFVLLLLLVFLFYVHQFTSWICHAGQGLVRDTSHPQCPFSSG